MIFGAGGSSGEAGDAGDSGDGKGDSFTVEVGGGEEAGGEVAGSGGAGGTAAVVPVGGSDGERDFEVAGLGGCETSCGSSGRGKGEGSERGGRGE